MNAGLDDQSLDGYQPGGLAWLPSRSDVTRLLASSEQVELQPIYYGSNHTFLATLDGGAAGRSLAIYKPAKGEYPLYDFPTGTLYRREVATWLVDFMLGWSIVPPTTVGTGKYGVGSIQLFVETVDEAEVEVGELRRIALLDALINNADRKAEHCLPGTDGHVWGIDHGLTFHAQPKLRTVLWHFSGTAIPDAERRDLRQLLSMLQRQRGPAHELSDLLAREEWRALLLRTARLAETATFPDPRYKPIPYRW